MGMINWNGAEHYSTNAAQSRDVCAFVNDLTLKYCSRGECVTCMTASAVQSGRVTLL